MGAWSLWDWCDAGQTTACDMPVEEFQGNYRWQKVRDLRSKNGHSRGRVALGYKFQVFGTTDIVDVKVVAAKSAPSSMAYRPRRMIIGWHHEFAQTWHHG